MVTIDVKPELSTRHYAAIAKTLEHCEPADDLHEFRIRLMEGLHLHFGRANTTFLTGTTYTGAFADPDPVVTGAIVPIIDEYRERWFAQDMFALPQSYARLSQSPALSHANLGSLPNEARIYLENFLYRHRLRSAAVLHVVLSRGQHGLVGIFDREERPPTEAELHAWTILARQLSRLAASLPPAGEARWDACLTPRLREVGRLMADGHTNDEIASLMMLSPDSIKKYVSRTFEATGVRNRAEFVRLAMTKQSLAAAAPGSAD